MQYNTENKFIKSDKIGINQAAQALREGKLVGIATETVYGLAASATNDEAVAKIFAAKKRPNFNPLIVHVSSLEMAEKLAHFDERARKLTSIFWPGALTFVLPRKANTGLSLLACAGLDTIALRLPRHDAAKQLIDAAGPLAAPSANPSGYLSPTRAHDLHPSILSAVEYVLDGGDATIGLESSVIDLSGTNPTMLRLGGVTKEEIEKAIGKISVAIDEPDSPKSPGQLLKHYAPCTPLRLSFEIPRHNEALLAFGSPTPSGFAKTLNLSETGDCTEAAANLFKFLHELDKGGFDAIACMPIPEAGLGQAINDRLRRAAQSFE